MKRTYRKNIFSGFIGLIIILSVTIFSSPAQAESLDSFDAVVHFTDSQTNKELSYFDIQLAPEQKENLTVTLVNKGEQPLTLKAAFNRAVTNSAGVIEYSGINKDTAATTPYNIEELVTLSDSEIKLEPKQTKDITLAVAMPKNTFDGVLAGGVYFEALSDEKVEGNIKNIFSREIALLIHSNTADVKPDIVVDTAKADQVNYRNVIEVGVENKASTYVKNVTIDYRVLLDDKEVLSRKKEKLSLAPNTRMPFRIPFDGEEFGNGKYTVDITVSTDEDKWSGSPTFTISKGEAEDFNKSDVTVKKAGLDLPWSSIALVAVLLILGIVILLMVNKNKKLKKELAKKRRKRKKRPTSAAKNN